MFSDYFIFVRELPKSFSQIGAMLPSSRALGRKMVQPVFCRQGPLRILEVGPGTGPFTHQIVENMGSEDEFVVCEINPRFIECLKDSLARNAAYNRHRERITFFEGPVQLLPDSGLPVEYDVIISSLPFVNFDPDTVEEILHQFKDMISDGGSLAFYQYLGAKKFREVFSGKRTRTRVKGVEEVLDRWCLSAATTGSLKRRISLCNLPPAVAIEFSF